MRAAAALALLSLCACADKTDAPRVIAGADADAGLAVIERVGCAACHRVPGVAWPTGSVGGSKTSDGSGAEGAEGAPPDDAL